MTHTFTDPDLIELDRIWPLGQKLVMPDGGTILVAGAYEGRYMHYLSEMFPKASVIGYEPQPTAFKTLLSRTRPLLNTVIYCKGLATRERYMELGNYGTDGASVLTHAGERKDVEMLDAVEAIQSVDPLALFVMNMEGYEWALLPYLLDEMMHHRIASFAIQFHPAYVSPGRAQRVMDYLGEYYNNTFNCPSWTYWQRKD